MLLVYVCQSVIVNRRQSCFHATKFPVCTLEHWIQIVLSQVQLNLIRNSTLCELTDCLLHEFKLKAIPFTQKDYY